MTLFQLILRSLRQRSLSSLLTALSVGLGVMLVSGILLLQHEMEQHFREPGRGYSVVVGSPGSALQLVLNSVYHLDKSPGLMPMRMWPELEAHESVALAVPYAVGDSFRGFRVVATTEALFDERFPHPEGSGEAKLAEGRPFRFDRAALFARLRELGASGLGGAVDHEVVEEPGELAEHDQHAEDHDEHGEEDDDEHAEHGEEDDEHDEHTEHGEDHDDEHAEHGEEDDEHGEDHDEHSEDHDEHSEDHDEHSEDHGEHAHAHGFEAVLGAEVARTLGIRVGDEIEPTHGVEGGAAHDHEHLWEVVGILRETGTPVDRVVFINLDSFFAIEEHLEGALIPGTEEAGLSTVLLFPRPGVHKAVLLSTLNRRPDLTVADVSEQIRNLFSIVGSVDTIFLLVSVLVVIIAVLSILVAIYNTMSERRREVAILRAIGASRRTVFASIIGEATLLTALGGIAGLLLGHLLVLLTQARVEEVAGFRPDWLRVLPVELLVLGLVVVGGALAGLLPAWKAYRTGVAENLRPLS